MESAVITVWRQFTGEGGRVAPSCIGVVSIVLLHREADEPDLSLAAADETYATVYKKKSHFACAL